MKKTLLERMQEAKNEYNKAYISVLNTKEIFVDPKYMETLMEKANKPEAFDAIGDVMYNANQSYSRNYDYDTLSLNLAIGIVYEAEYTDETNKITENAEPIKGIVRYYTMEANCYLDGEKTNTLEMGSARGRQGYINYNTLIKEAKENGLIFNGPKTFEEFKEKILVGEAFDISLSASLLDKEKQPVKTK